MKNIFFTLLISSVNTCFFAQNISISASIRDSIANNNFFYHASGQGVFGDSLIFNVELIDQIDSSKVYVGYKDFSDSTKSNITSFKYDLQSLFYSFDIGNYPKSDYIIHIWTLFGKEKRDELFYVQE
jgi:hypothetical protein